MVLGDRKLIVVAVERARMGWLGVFLQHCVEVGGKHAAPDHARLLISCAARLSNGGGFNDRQIRVSWPPNAPCAPRLPSSMECIDGRGMPGNRNLTKAREENP